jgi:hypothetical protein
LLERPVLDDPVRPDERERSTLRIRSQYLDDVAGEVEAIGDAPAALDQCQGRPGGAAVKPGSRRARSTAFV